MGQLKGPYLNPNTSKFEVPEGWKVAQFAVDLMPGNPPGATSWRDIQGRPVQWNQSTGAWTLVNQNPGTESDVSNTPNTNGNPKNEKPGRFDPQRDLIDAPEVNLSPSEIRSLDDVLKSAAKKETQNFRVGGGEGQPALIVGVGRPGSIINPEDYSYGPSAPELLKNPPSAHAGFWFDHAPDSPPNASGHRLFAQLKEDIPRILKQAGMKPGDIVSGTPIGVGRGDYKRMHTYMNSGAGPLDKNLKQVARIKNDYTLEPLLVSSSHEDSLGWY